MVFVVNRIETGVEETLESLCVFSFSNFLTLLDILDKLTATSWTGDSVTEAIDGPDALVAFPLEGLNACEALRTLKKRGADTFEGLEVTALLA